MAKTEADCYQAASLDHAGQLALCINLSQKSSMLRPVAPVDAEWFGGKFLGEAFRAIGSESRGFY
jgi:hypothetical protein